MADLCTNQVTIVGLHEDVAAFQRAVADDDRPLALNKILTPHRADNQPQSDANLAAWGVHHDLDEDTAVAGPERLPGGRSRLRFEFQTAYHPPVFAVGALARQHPQVAVVHSYQEPHRGGHGTTVYPAGAARWRLEEMPAPPMPHVPTVVELVEACESAWEHAGPYGADAIVFGMLPVPAADQVAALPLAWRRAFEENIRIDGASNMWTVNADRALDRLRQLTDTPACWNDEYERGGQTWDATAGDLATEVVSRLYGSPRLWHDAETSFGAVVFMLAWLTDQPVKDRLVDVARRLHAHRDRDTVAALLCQTVRLSNTANRDQAAAPGPDPRHTLTAADMLDALLAPFL